MGHQGSLSPTFVPGSHAFKNPVSPAFLFNRFHRTFSLITTYITSKSIGLIIRLAALRGCSLFHRYRCHQVSDPVKQNIGRPYFLIEGVLPQPNYPSAAVPSQVRNTKIEYWCYTCASTRPASLISELPITL